MKQPKYLLAPMVEGSELAFRMLCLDPCGVSCNNLTCSSQTYSDSSDFSRLIGAHGLYTPMIHSTFFSQRPDLYLHHNFQTVSGDTPLIVQVRTLELLISIRFDCLGKFTCVILSILLIR